MPITILLSVMLGGLAAVTVAIVAVVLSRRQPDTTMPRCGNCGYNLTGAPSNRCPECGQLFIEAGVITRQPTPSPPRHAARVTLLILVGLTATAVLGTVAMWVRSSAARARAVAARQAAVQAQQQAAARQAATTAPVAEERPADRPSEAP